MAKSIIPIKIIINSDSNGNATDGILQYKINDSGIISQAKTVSVFPGIGSEALTSLVSQAVESAKESEGIDG